MKNFSKFGVVALLAFGVACGGDDGGTDSGTDGSMADSGRPDSGADAATSDSGMDAATMDAATMDAATMDAATMDAGMDAAMMDAGPEEDGIAAVRAAAPGTHTPALPVRNVIVTYVRGAEPPDPAGFFVQAERTGPALFVAIDPAVFTPTPAVGDVVDFDVTETTVSGGQLRVTMLTGFTRDSTGADVSALVQDLSAATDVVTALDSYESELITISGRLTDASFGAGGAYKQIRLRTTGVDAPELTLRATDTIFGDAGLRDGCIVTIGPSPLWRYNARAQAQAYVMDDVTVTSCSPVPGSMPRPGELVITEIFYDYDDGTVTSDTNREWFEVHNPSATQTYNLLGCELGDSAHTALVTDSVPINPGAYVVIGGVASEASPLADLPFALNNGGDLVAIRCGGDIVDQVEYGASGDWPRANGVSLQLSRGLDSSDNDLATNWCLTDPRVATYGTGGQGGTPGAENARCPSTVIFSEYVEGSRSNKALELSVIAGAAMPLTSCEIRRYNNGATMPSDTYAFDGAGTLALAGVFTVCHPMAGFAATCDTTDGITSFNGDDALELYCDGVLVDSIGQVGFDPGSAWIEGGVSTANATLRRRCAVTMGDTDSSDRFDPSAEWTAADIDDISDLGLNRCL